MFVEIFFELLVVLVLLLAVLLFFFFLRAKKKKKALKELADKAYENKPKKQDLSTLYKVLQNDKASSKDLKETLDIILEDYGVIDDFLIYQEILLSITIHPNTNKNIILSFDRSLSKLNPTYKQEISKTVTDALNSRIS